MFVGSSNELGAFESGFEANGNVTAVVLRKYDFTLIVATTANITYFRKLDLRKDIEDHENQD
jgi:hypothetical protein